MSDTKHVLDLALDDRFVERLRSEYQYQPEDEMPPITPSPDPSVSEIKNLVETAFWASLTREEGGFHDFRLAFMPVDESDDNAFVFKEPLTFEAETLAKIAPALPPSFRISVWRTKDAARLQIWGIVPPDYGIYGFFIEASAGEIIVSLQSGLRAVISPTLGAQFVDPDKVSFVQKQFRPQAAPEENYEGTKPAYSSDLREIAKAMRKHGHGGTLLVVPNDVENKLDELIFLDRFIYECHLYETVKRDLESRDKAFRDRTQKEKAAEKDGTILLDFQEPDEAEPALRARESLRSVGHLTAADGATLVTRDFSVLGFGAKINSNSIGEAGKVSSVCISEPFEDSTMERKKFSELGWGTRHQSAAQYVANSKSIAIVASQDSVVSFLAWDETENAVRVIRHAEFVL